ncbi:hypothetical protein EJ05DRAFT_437881 [Pseudovirgaria hyperparasitica]|uniref:Serine hydrolase domain-containing protein n=1 Tax=Pseudovirgaria hyperparasitica TaxID=470096 RepID=A0A6A6W7F9_9PEZI|nr:uncharacterized protein EJ05DRAFT_437881 [Pseudovirgaria hyperparasitica]KAF2758828.1 hypothetical protein EJ05DRAFT_437881 [Pseudovirgaria hyperparasitica]
MKFLCLHGSIGNTDNFSIQLAPLEKDLAQDHAASFRYMNAPVEVDPPHGFETYFGIGPHYRWLTDGGLGALGLLERIRSLPTGDTPEDVMRKLLLGGRDADTNDIIIDSTRSVLELLHRVLEDDPEIEGIVGYSEGSCLGSTLIMDEIRRHVESGRQRRIKCAIFFTGWPPLGADSMPVLSDESDFRIDIPSLHVIGANADPYKNGAVALYNLCDDNTAKLFDTGKGHTIPRGGMVIHELADAVREMIENVRDGSSVEES